MEGPGRERKPSTGTRDIDRLLAVHFAERTLFDQNFTPSGLHVESGQELAPLNLNVGEGNFYLKPNGVFFLDGAGARILESVAFKNSGAHPSLAVQSGPLLLSEGSINAQFSVTSTNRHIRSAVGIDEKGRAIFVISREPVTFHELATLCKSRLKCNDAIYLDGVISKFYPTADPQDQAVGDFAGIFGVVEP